MEQRGMPGRKSRMPRRSRVPRTVVVDEDEEAGQRGRETNVWEFAQRFAAPADVSAATATASRFDTLRSQPFAYPPSPPPPKPTRGKAKLNVEIGDIGIDDILALGEEKDDSLLKPQHKYLGPAAKPAKAKPAQPRAQRQKRPPAKPRLPTLEEKPLPLSSPGLSHAMSQLSVTGLPDQSQENRDPSFKADVKNESNQMGNNTREFFKQQMDGIEKFKLHVERTKKVNDDGLLMELSKMSIKEESTKEEPAKKKVSSPTEKKSERESASESKVESGEGGEEGCGGSRSSPEPGPRDRSQSTPETEAGAAVPTTSVMHSTPIVRGRRTASAEAMETEMDLSTIAQDPNFLLLQRITEEASDSSPAQIPVDAFAFVTKVRGGSRGSSRASSRSVSPCPSPPPAPSTKALRAGSLPVPTEPRKSDKLSVDKNVSKMAPSRREVRRKKEEWAAQLPVGSPEFPQGREATLPNGSATAARRPTLLSPPGTEDSLKPQDSTCSPRTPSPSRDDSSLGVSSPGEDEAVETGAVRATLLSRLSYSGGYFEPDYSEKTPLEKVLWVCAQADVLSWAELFPAGVLEEARKIGEGSYGEVFKLQDPRRTDESVIKVIPVHGNQVVNGEPQKSLEEILPEVLIAQELSNLRRGGAKEGEGPERPCFATDCYVEVRRAALVLGPTPDSLLRAWDEFDARKGSENDRPDFFLSKQLFLVFEFADGGVDLEGFVFESLAQAEAVLCQVTLALAVAEAEMEFEHRDLHVGNVLVKRTEEESVRFWVDSKPLRLRSHGVHVHIIDFTNSRLNQRGAKVYLDLNADPEIFNGTASEYQFEVYRLMRDACGGNWKAFNPRSNALWLHYLTDYLLSRPVFAPKSAKAKAAAVRLAGKDRRRLQTFKDQVAHFPSASALAFPVPDGPDLDGIQPAFDRVLLSSHSPEP